MTERQSGDYVYFFPISLVNGNIIIIVIIIIIFCTLGSKDSEG